MKKNIILFILGVLLFVPSQQAYANSQKEDAEFMRIGLFLPFLDKSDAQRARFVEYYEGFLLAVEDLKTKGYSMEVYAFDIESDAKLSGLLESVDIKDLDLIVGGVTSTQIATLANFTEQEGIKYIISFPVKDAPRFGSNAFLVNKSHSSMNGHVVQIYSERFRDSNTIFLTDRSNDNRADFVADLSQQLSADGQVSHSLAVSLDLEDSLLPLLSSTKNNVLVPSSNTAETLNKTIPVLKMMQEKYPEYKIQLFGYPDWQTYTQYKSDFCTLNAVIYSSFFVEESPEIASFVARYTNWYGKSMMNTYPKYCMLGYDTGLFFITALGRYGFNFEKKISNVNVSTLQTAFSFRAEKGQKEYANNGVYFIYYTEQDIKKIDCSR